MSIRIAHLTDPHLPLEAVGPRALQALPAREGLVPFLGKRALGLLSWALRRSRWHRAEVLDAVLADVADFAPDLVLVTGDLVHLALPREFAAARAWLERLAALAPVHLVPGNHDAYVPGALEAGGRLWAPWTHGCVAHGDYPWAMHRGTLTLLGLSSAVPQPLHRAAGRLGAVQLARAEGILRAAEGVRLVLLHHPPLAGDSPRRALEDRADFAALVARTGAELVLCGHEHRFRIASLEGPAGPVPVLVGPSASLAHETPADRAGGWLALELDPARRTLEVVARRFDGRGMDEGGRWHLALPPASVEVPAREVALP